tara:strand:- start:103 stop:1095 length:993 start_codon:yes stop_codon:yes gene_type:complete
MKINKINIGIIGLGVGFKHYKNLKNNKYCIINSVCDFDKKKLDQIKDEKIIKTKNSKLITSSKDVNLVIICSYDNYHFQHVCESINNNKHVFVEKPFCMNSKELKIIKEILKRKKNIKIGTNLHLKHAPQFQILNKKIKNKQFGNIYHFSGEYNYSRYYKLQYGWRGKINYYSVLLGGAIHLIDIMVNNLGDNIAKVMAIGNKIASSKKKFKHYDFVTCLIKFKKPDIIAKITANFGSNGPHNHYLRIDGTKQTFVQNFPDQIYFTGKDNNFKMIKSKIKKNEYYIKIYIDKFIDEIVLNKKNNTKNIFKVLEIIFALEESLEKERWIGL